MARRTGKIARLPKDVRDTLNFELEQGTAYKQICSWLESEGYPGCNEGHVSSWFKGGHQDWLRQEQYIREVKERRDYAEEFVCGSMGGDTFQEANLQLAAIQCFEVLAQLDVKALQAQLAEKPETYVRLINSLCRLTKSRGEFAVYKQEKQKRERSGHAAFMLEELLRQGKEAAKGRSRGRRREKEDRGKRMENGKQKGEDLAGSQVEAKSQSSDESPESRASGSEDVQESADESELVGVNASSCELKLEVGEQKAADRRQKVRAKKQSSGGERKSRASEGQDGSESAGDSELVGANASSCDLVGAAKCEVREVKLGALRTARPTVMNRTA
jgi:hypothetical protein